MHASSVRLATDWLLDQSEVAERSVAKVKGSGGLVTEEVFLSSPDCSKEARALIETLEQRFDGQVRMIFGKRTMTANRQPSGQLLRIIKERNAISSRDQAVSRELAARLKESIREGEYAIEGTEAFREAVITAVKRALEEEENAK